MERNYILVKTEKKQYNVCTDDICRLYYIRKKPSPQIPTYS